MSSTNADSAESSLQLSARSWFAQILRRFRWTYHPITVFVGLQILWVVLIVLWVNWFYEGQNQLAQVMRAIGSQAPDMGYQVAFLTAGIVLLVMILIGVVFLFVVTVRQGNINRQQRSFVSSVTHELRSPLASLRLLIETLTTRKTDPETQAKILSMMQGDTDRLSRLVDQILVSGRLDRGVMSFGRTEDIDLGELIRSVVDTLRYADPEVSSRVGIELSSRVVVHSLRPALTLILSNLLENAIKYSPPGSPVKVQVVVGRQWLQLKVSDRGQGLVAADRRRIFKMFHRAQNAIDKAIPGTGLGLYIVRETAKVLGGRVTADSEGLGQGSCFTLTLPLVEKVAKS